MWSDEESDIVIEENMLKDSDQIVRNNELNDSEMDYIEEDEVVNEELNQTDDLAYAANNHCNSDICHNKKRKNNKAYGKVKPIR